MGQESRDEQDGFPFEKRADEKRQVSVLPDELLKPLHGVSLYGRDLAKERRTPEASKKAGKSPGAESFACP
ncbi:hypothetical protein JCM15519_02060 [Fundidesulfovibrio butyratiphilus]